MKANLLETRKRLEAKIDELIDLLDLLDGDPDLEDNGDDEPSLGSTPLMGTNGIEYDLEFDTADDEFTGDEQEPEHGWPNPCGLQVHVREELRELIKQGYVA